MDVREKQSSEKRLIDYYYLAEKIECPGEPRVYWYDIEAAPTVDAVEVVHGRWIDKGEYAVCTECGGRSGTQYDGVEPIPLMTQFCPNCGEKMDGVEEQEK